MPAGAADRSRKMCIRDSCYICDMDLDEDEMVRFLSASFDNCPYFQLDDEYRIVRRQM